MIETFDGRDHHYVVEGERKIYLQRPLRNNWTKVGVRYRETEFIQSVFVEYQ